MKKEEKNLVIVFIAIFFITNLIGYICNISILKSFMISENVHIISFVPLCISIVVTLIYYIITKIIKKRNNNM